MTATYTTTDRSRSVTTLNSPRRTLRHRAKPKSPHGMFQSKPPPRFCAHAHQQPSNPRQNHAPTPRHCLTASRARSTRRPLSFLRLSLLFLRSLLSPPPQSVICPTTALVHTRPSTLHQLLPVPGPDPARLPLWWLGGVRARPRPQTPITSRIGCGRALHRPVHTLVRRPLASSPRVLWRGGGADARAARQNHGQARRAEALLGVPFVNWTAHTSFQRSLHDNIAAGDVLSSAPQRQHR